MTRVAVIGVGSIAKPVHLPLLLGSECKAVGVMSRSGTTAEAAARIRAILAKLDAEDISPEEWVHLNWEFHDSLCACAGHEFLRRTISSLRRNMEPYLRLDIAQVANHAAGRREPAESSRRACAGTGEPPPATPSPTCAEPPRESSGTCGITGNSSGGGGEGHPSREIENRAGGLDRRPDDWPPGPGRHFVLPDVRSAVEQLTGLPEQQGRHTGS